MLLKPVKIKINPQMSNIKIIQKRAKTCKGY